MSGVSAKEDPDTKVKVITTCQEQHGPKSTQRQAWIVGKTIAVFLFHFAMGLYVSSLGLTLIHLSVLYGVQTSAFSTVFVSQGVGNIAGAAVSALVFDRLPYEPQLALISLLGGLAAFLAPWLGSVYAFAALRGVTSFVIGYVEPSSNPFVVLLWGVGSRMAAPVLQAKNTMYSVGALLSPLIIRHFLVPLSTEDSNSTSSSIDNVTSSLANHVCSPSINDDSSEWSNATIGGAVPDYVADSVGLVRWAFAAGGVAFLASSVVYAVAWTCGKKTVRARHEAELVANQNDDDAESAFASSTTAEEEIRETVSDSSACKEEQHDLQKAIDKDLQHSQHQQQHKEQSRVIMALVTCVLVVFFFCHVWAMLTLMQLLSTLAQCGLGWDVATATRLVTVFYAALVAGRVTCIPLSVIVPPTVIIWANIALQASGLALLLAAYMAVGPIGEWGVWVGSALAGLGVSSVIGSVFVWVARNMTISGASSAVLMLGCYVGAFAGPTLSAMAVRHAGYATIVQSALVSCILQALSFAVAVILVGRMTKSRLVKNTSSDTATSTQGDAKTRSVDSRRPTNVKVADLKDEEEVEESRPLTTSHSH